MSDLKKVPAPFPAHTVQSKLGTLLALLACIGAATAPVDVLFQYLLPPITIPGTPLHLCLSFDGCEHAPPVISWAQQLGAMAMAMIPAAAAAIAFGALARLALLYGSGELFSARSQHHLKISACAFLAYGILRLGLEILTHILQSWHTTAHGYSFNLDYETSEGDGVTFIAAAGLFLLHHVMAQARRLAEQGRDIV